MSMRYPGGLIAPTPVNQQYPSGVWTGAQTTPYQTNNVWANDSSFKNTTMLLHGDGATTPFNADASTNNFNVTINGDAKSNNFNPYLGTGYYSNYFASGAYIRAGTSANLALGSGAWTCESWVFPTSFTTTAGPLWDFRNVGGYVSTAPLITFNSSGTVQYQNTLTSTNAVSLNTWSHIAVVRNGTTVTIYINGVANGTVTDSTTMTNTYCCIGAVNDAPSSYYLTSYVSNARLVVGTAVYTAAFTPTTSPLTAISGTQFLSCQSNRFIDNSTNAFTLSLNGSPQVSPAIPFTLPSSVATYGSGYFDGTGDYLTAPSNSAFAMGTGDFTIECWVNTPLVGSSDDVFIELRASGATSTGFVFNVHQTGVGYQLNFYTDGGSNLGSTVLNYNVWNHCAVTRSGTTVRLFSNGVVSATFTKANNFSDTPVPRIGSSPLYSPSSVIGYISNLRVVKGTAVYTSAFTPSTTPLTAITNTSLLTTQYNGGGNNSGFKDSSQFNFPITRNGNTTQGTFTPYGSNWSNFFDGSGDYLTTPQNAAFNLSTAAFTVEAFIYMTANNGSNMRIIGLGDGVNGSPAYYSGWALNVASSLTQLQFIKYDGTVTEYVPSYSFSLNTWYHVVAVRNGSSSFSMYVNGTRIYNATVTTSFNNVNSNALNLGYQYDGASPAGVKYFNGYISNARVVAGTAVYDPTVTTLTVPTTPLTAITNTAFLTSQSNRFIDTSSNAFAITSNGNTSVQRFSPFAPLTVYNPTTYGGSLYGDGTGDYLSIAYSASNSLNAGDFTVEAWVYKNSNAAYMAVGGTMTSAAPYNTKWQIIGDSGGTKITWCSDAFLITSSATLYTGTWYHVAFVRSSGTLRLYINGVLDGSSADTRNYNSATDLWVAQVPENVSGRNWNGYITNFRINPTTAVYTAAFTPPTAPLTATTGTSFLLATTNAGILDNAMMNNLETVGNAAVSTSVKKYGTGSLYFDGSGDRLYEPSNQNFNFGTGDFTIELWVYPISQGGHGNSNNDCLIDFRPAANGVYGTLYIFSSGTGIYWYVNSANRITGGAISNGVWTHIAICRSSGSTKLFLNGTQSGSTYTDANNYLVAPIMIGEFNDGAGAGNFNGYIDDLRVTKGVARYVTNFTPPVARMPNQ